MDGPHDLLQFILHAVPQQSPQRHIQRTPAPPPWMHPAAPNCPQPLTLTALPTPPPPRSDIIFEWENRCPGPAMLSRTSRVCHPILTPALTHPSLKISTSSTMMTKSPTHACHQEWGIDPPGLLESRLSIDRSDSKWFISLLALH